MLTVYPVLSCGKLTPSKAGAALLFTAISAAFCIKNSEKRPAWEPHPGNPVINANRLMLVKLIKVDRANFLENRIIKEGDNASKRESALIKIVKGQQDKYIFLPEYKELYASVVDLQNLYAIGFDEYRNNYERLATIASPFLKDIQSRFSSYYGRQGQPDLNKNELIRKHKNDLSEDG